MGFLNGTSCHYLVGLVPNLQDTENISKHHNYWQKNKSSVDELRVKKYIYL